MSVVAEVLAAVREAGGEVQASEGKLKVTAPAPLSSALVEELRRHKGEVLAALDTSGFGAGWDAEDWRAFFDERAGIAEHDGGLPRADAETRAYECCVMEWLWRYPSPASGPERCAHCGKGLGEFDGIPFLTGDGGHTWLHDRCHGLWTAKRRAEAVAALAILGIRLEAEKS